MPRVQFNFSYSRPIAGGFAQRNNQKYVIDVPGDKLSYKTLRAAEAAFTRWFQATHADDELIQWQAVSGAEGIVSRYRALLRATMGGKR